MKYLLILILPILFILGCKKPEEVKPVEVKLNNSETKYYIGVEHSGKWSFDQENIIPQYSNDTIYCYFSNMTWGDKFEDSIRFSIRVGSNDSISINNNLFKNYYTEYIFTDLSKTNEIDIKTKEGKKYHYKLILKRVYASHTLQCELDSLCTDSFNIQRNVKTEIPFVSGYRVPGGIGFLSNPTYVYTDQVSEINGLVNYRLFFYSDKDIDYSGGDPLFPKCIGFDFKNLNRNYSDIVKNYTIGKDVFVNARGWRTSKYMYYEFTEKAKDIKGTVTITSFDPKTKTVSGTYSFSCISDLKTYKSSAAKITVTNGKFENIALWNEY